GPQPITKGNARLCATHYRQAGRALAQGGGCRAASGCLQGEGLPGETDPRGEYTLAAPQRSGQAIQRLVERGVGLGEAKTHDASDRLLGIESRNRNRGDAVFGHEAFAERLV